jgi:hypothetical protein
MTRAKSFLGFIGSNQFGTTHDEPELGWLGLAQFPALLQANLADAEVLILNYDELKNLY